MGSKKTELSAHAAVIQHGLALANRQMMERAAAFDRTLVEGNRDGSFEEHSARLLLLGAQQSRWWREHFEE